MDCADARANLWDYLDEELAAPDCSALRSHLAHCRRCHFAYCFDRSFLERLAQLSARCGAPPVVRVRIQQLLRSTQPH